MPRTDAYLASLPAGAASYPSCRASAEVFHPMVNALLRVRGEDTEALIRQFCPSGLPAKGWVPEPLLNALLLMRRDLFFDDDEAFLADAYEVNADLYRRPLYRALMFVMSPTLALMGCRKRWSAFRLGSELTSRIVQREEYLRVVKLSLVHPPGLHLELHLRGLGEAFRAAANAAGGKETRIRLEPTEVPGRACWQIEYQG